MRSDPAQLLESPDSASPIVSRSVAAGLVGEYHQTYPTNRLQRSALRLLGIFPSGLVRELVSRAQAFTAIKPSSLVGLSVESLAKARVNDYDHLNDTFPAAVIGAALGGAAANLSLAMGGPFLPQAFILTLKGGSPDGNPTTYFHRSADLARQIARQNPDVITIQHFDPVHDGWITKRANHLRLKLTGLPHVYLDFLRRKVQPGGTIYYLECEAGWLRYRTGERSFFQVGGWGGLSPQDFLSPSPALLDYCRTNRLKVCDWQLPGFPLENGPESEWGSEKGLGEALSEFCKEEGYDFVRIQLPEPLDYARLAFSAVSQLLSEEGRNPEGVLIEMFSQFDPTAARLGSLLPLWLVFNTWDSLEFLKEMRSEFPEDKPVFFTAVSTFSMTPDGVPWSEWEQALAGLDWRNIGPRPSHYPSDPLTLIHWNKPLRRWVETQKKPIQGRLTADQVKSLVEKIKPYRTML